jgi:hypothetical protein
MPIGDARPQAAVTLLLAPAVGLTRSVVNLVQRLMLRNTIGVREGDRRRRNQRLADQGHEAFARSATTMDVAGAMAWPPFIRSEVDQQPT